MFCGTCFPDVRSANELTNRYHYGPASNILRPDVLGPAFGRMYGGWTMNGFSNMFDPDPLTPLELADIEESLADLRAGRYRIFYEDMSDEDFLANL